MKDDYIKVRKRLEEIQIKGLVSRYGSNYLENHESTIEYLKNSKTINHFLSVQKFDDVEFDLFETALNSTMNNKLLITKYENPLSIAILNSLFDRISKSAEELGMTAPYVPFLGTSLSRNYNAFACNVPDSKHNIIMFESELFTLANMLAKLVASCLPDFEIKEDGVSFSLEKERIKKHIEGSSVIQKRFADIVFNVMRKGEPLLTTQYFIEDEFLKLSYVLLTSLELFVVGHEYGHIYAGHLDDSNSVSSVKIGDDEIEAIATNWKMEFQADELGLILLLKSLSSDELPPFSYLGPELFFIFLDLEDRLKQFHKTGIDSRSGIDEWISHPPNSERRDRVRMLMFKTLPNEFHETYNSLSIFLEDVLELLWENYRTKLSELTKL